MKHRSFEVVVHPGSEFYEQEKIELLESPWRDSLMFPVHLMNYFDL